MAIEISLVQRDKQGNERKVLKSFESGQEAANWYEKQPRPNKGNKFPNKRNKDNVK